MTSPETIHAVEAFLFMPFILMGLSHILQPQLWVGFFSDLVQRGASAVIWRTFSLELWPAVLIVSLHQDWAWPGVLITLYGNALMAKIALSLLAPDLGLRSIRHAAFRDGYGMQVAGVVLFGLGALCAGRTLL